LQLELTDEERDALAKYLRAGIDADRLPLSPRLKPIKAVLAKLIPPPLPKPPKPENTERAEARQNQAASVTRQCQGGATLSAVDF
jgi:hypothetical protein